ncbi:MAG: hypothetical protein B6D39_01330 [Anaerolineae bacterium UTCFX2]|jgi:hypothetical protein|nr:DUF1360 domain-containing protein [Anaerolineales bacterium]OQY94586.1 MAG: hypothetical protein B6D39_01330 [Anaerolineae bacterium UTCFX2]
MQNQIDASRRTEYQTKLFLAGLFLAAFAVFILTQNARQFSPSIFDLALLSLATFRLGRMVAYDTVFEPLRAPFCVTVPDSTGAGDTVEPKGTGARYAMGQLLSCPLCSGTWISAGLIYALYFLPTPTRAFLFIIAAVAIAEMLGSVTEALSWSGQLARARSGAVLNQKKTNHSAISVHPVRMKPRRHHNGIFRQPG